MDTQVTFKRYSTHYEAIKRIGKYPLKRELQLADLGEGKDKVKMMKAITQRCYADMKKDGMSGSVIDYLCIISTLFIYDSIPLSEKQPEKAVQYIIDNYESNHKEEIHNLLRFFNKRPTYFLGLLNSNTSELYKKLAGFWFLLYNRKK